MKSIFKKLLLLTVVALLGYGAYDYVRRGYHTLPEMPAGAWPLDFENDIRVIMVDVPDENLERRYLAMPAADMPKWLEGAWSFCRKPTDKVKKQTNKSPPDRGMRLDAVCSVDADGEIIHTAMIFSVPRL